MEEHIAHSGAWGIALIVIVIASWLLLIRLNRFSPQIEYYE